MRGARPVFARLQASVEQAQVNQKVAQIVTEPEFRKRLNEIGGVAPMSGNTAEAFGEVLQREVAVLSKAAKDLGLQLD